MWESVPSNHRKPYLKMKKIPFYFLALVLFSCSPNQEEKEVVTETIIEEKIMEETPDSVLRHVVLFGFKESASQEDIDQVVAAFENLPNEIPEIKGFEWGTNNSPEGLNQGLTHAFTLTFYSEEDRAIYLPHPAHKAFGEVLGPHLDKVTVVDYWTK